MLREPVISISIAAVGYDPVRRTLEVEYKNGAIVRYPGVPANDEEDRMGEAPFAKLAKYANRPPSAPDRRP